jgi:hypothetical protein
MTHVAPFIPQANRSPPPAQATLYFLLGSLVKNHAANGVPNGRFGRC